jgi:hypothetical protein
MSTTSERITTRPIVRRFFESSRHQRSNLIAAFEHVLPVIGRRHTDELAPRQAIHAPSRSRRAVS